MKKISFIFCLFAFYFAFGQDSIKTSGQLNELVLTEKNGKVQLDDEKPATFPLGLTAFRNMISNNFRMRKVSSNTDIEYCEIMFIIDKEGSIVEVKALGLNPSFNKEAEASVLKIKQKWIPAEINGEKVRYRFKFPLTITFTKK